MFSNKPKCEVCADLDATHILTFKDHTELSVCRTCINLSGAADIVDPLLGDEALSKESKSWN